MLSEKLAFAVDSVALIYEAGLDSRRTVAGPDSGVTGKDCQKIIGNNSRAYPFFDDCGVKRLGLRMEFSSQ